MTRTQQVVMLIEAAGPLTFDTIRFALQWTIEKLSHVMDRLKRFGVVTVRNINKRRYYVMVQA